MFWVLAVCVLALDIDKVAAVSEAEVAIDDGLR